MSASDSERGGLWRAAPEVAPGRNKQPRRYIISDDLQALAIALSPLSLAILLAIYLRGLQ